MWYVTCNMWYVIYTMNDNIIYNIGCNRGHDSWHIRDMTHDNIIYNIGCNSFNIHGAGGLDVWNVLDIIYYIYYILHVKLHMFDIGYYL